MKALPKGRLARLSIVCLLLLGCGLLLLCTMAQAGTVTYVYSDPQGTPLAEADAQGNITATFDYRPYGTQALGHPPSGPGYTGHVNDPDTGFVYMQARYYDPGVGRFLSVDPVGPGAGNGFNFGRYVYANNNPVVNVDRDGRETGIAFHSEWKAMGGHTVPTAPNDPIAEPLMIGMAAVIAAPVVTAVAVAAVATAPEAAMSGSIGAAGAGGGILAHDVDEAAAKTITRYMGSAEARAATQSGEIPNVGRDGVPRPTHVTTDAPLSSASEAKAAYELPEAPTHKATVPASRVSDLGPTPDGRSLTSGGGSQRATNQPIPVKPDEIEPLGH